MKKILTALVLSSLVSSVDAITYNDTITAIFGGGNPDTGWTSDTGSGMTLALRGKNFDTGATPQPNTLGTYEFATGVAANNAARAKWNWEFSINSGSAALNAVDFYVGIDTDPSQGISYAFVNALLVWTDNSYGNNLTLNGAGVETGLAAALLAGDRIAQQSQNLVFAGGNPLLNATYNYELFAVASGAGSTGARLAEVGITVIVGEGGAAVPETGSTLALLGFAAVGLGALRRKFQA